MDDFVLLGDVANDETEDARGIWKSVADHAADLEGLPGVASSINFTFAGKKSVIAEREVVVLGVECSNEGRMVTDKRFDKVAAWPTVHSVRTKKYRASLHFVL